MTLIKGTKNKAQLREGMKKGLTNGVPVNCQLTKQQKRNQAKKINQGRNMSQEELDDLYGNFQR